MALRELYAWMRDANVLYARCGELELRLEPQPLAPRVVTPDPPGDDEAEDERRSLETLLYSSGVEAEPFLRALRRKAA